MTAYYNENDPGAAAWLRELMKEGLIAYGEVDDRSILEVEANDLRPFRQCHFFAGIGGWSHALRLAGWPDDRPCWTGSPPCQPFSAAGKRKGGTDERHLWPGYFGLIAQHRPPAVFGEQVAAAINNGWLDAVFADMESEGYACAATVLPACSVGAPHLRPRLWFVADDQRSRATNIVGHADSQRQQKQGLHLQPGRQDQTKAHQPWASPDWVPCLDGKARPVEPGTQPLAHGIPARMVRLRGYGNAIVPQVAAEVIGAFMDVMDLDHAA